MGLLLPFLVSKRVFSYVKEQVWKQIWGWCLRRHPIRRASWSKKKYFMCFRGQDWVFFGIKLAEKGTKQVRLKQIHLTPIKRHIKVKGKASPDNPELKDYWEKRRVITYIDIYGYILYVYIAVLLRRC